jgi:hypothetical protein
MLVAQTPFALSLSKRPTSLLLAEGREEEGFGKLSPNGIRAMAEGKA